MTKSVRNLLTSGDKIPTCSSDVVCGSTRALYILIRVCKGTKNFAFLNNYNAILF